MTLVYTCYHITDIDRSIAFYKMLGFDEVGRIAIRNETISVFMKQPGDGDWPKLELTYNFGVDSYEQGTGYGYIAITRPDLDTTLAALSGLGVQPEGPPYSMHETGARVVFIRDPDGYRVKILEQSELILE